jgi:hypothetical protein
MHPIRLIAVCLLALGSTVSGERIHDDHILWGRQGKPTSLVKRAVATSAAVAPPALAVATDHSCSNGPLTRNCWSSGFSISTDFDIHWPNTTQVRNFNLEITNSTCNFNGQSRQCLLINGQFPGPKIHAQWGDIIRVTLKNSLTTNGTGLHWHGIRQWHTGSQDGVPGITECPLAPGDTKVYQFQATQVQSLYRNTSSRPLIADSMGRAGTTVIGRLSMETELWGQYKLTAQLQRNTTLV